MAERKRKRKGGRTSRLEDAKLVDALLNALKAGSYVEAACHANGLHPSTYYGWMERGEADHEAGKTDTPHARFFDAATRAHGEAEVAMVAVLRRHAVGVASEDGDGWKIEPDWRAAVEFLKRRHPKRWGDTNRVELGGESAVNFSALSRAAASFLEQLEADHAERDP